MESCGVCFPCGKTAQGRDALRRAGPAAQLRSRLPPAHHAWKDVTDTPTLRLEYRFFHPAIIRDLMSEIGQTSRGSCRVLEVRPLVQGRPAGCATPGPVRGHQHGRRPGAGALVLKAQGRDPLGLLREIRKAILGQRIGEEPEELLTLDGTTVARSALATVIDGRVLDVQNELGPGRSLCSVLRGSGARTRRGQHEIGKPKMNIDPEPLNAGEKLREVFISYAWGMTRLPRGEDPRRGGRRSLCGAREGWASGRSEIATRSSRGCGSRLSCAA